MIRDYYRFANFIIFILISLILMFHMFYFHNLFFYLIEKNDFSNWPRLLFAFDSVLIGYSLVILESSIGHFPDKKPWLVFVTYFTRYLIVVILLSLIIFVIFSAIESTSSYLYYFTVLPVGVTLGYVIDFFVSIHFTLSRYLDKN